MCKHHEPFIDYANGLCTYVEGFKSSTEKYGIENEGYIWCKHCGEEISNADFETQEEFLESGARNVTHEVIEKEEIYESKENNEFVETIRKIFIDGDDKSIKSQSLSIIKIINVITNVMGIKLNNNDEVSLIKICNNLEKSNITPKNRWIQLAKTKQKKASISLLEKAYENYRIKNIILYTASNLFLFLQSSHPSYIITKSFSNCKPSLNGYPLDKKYKYDGINYIACILQSLSSIGLDWSNLKKINIKEQLIKIIDKSYKDDFIQYRYKIKQEFIKSQNKEIETVNNQEYQWHEFRPPLNLFNVSVKSLKSYNIDPNIKEIKKHNTNSKRMTKLMEDFNEAEYLLSLKLIEEIDEHIMENDVVNPKFDPTPLDNSCCLQDININYNFIDFFSNPKSNINKIIKILKDFNSKKAVIHNMIKDNHIYIKSDLSKSLISFNPNIGMNDEDITEEDIQQLCVNYRNGYFRATTFV